MLNVKGATIRWVKVEWLQMKPNLIIHTCFIVRHLYRRNVEIEERGARVLPLGSVESITRIRSSTRSTCTPWYFIFIVSMQECAITSLIERPRCTLTVKLRGGCTSGWCHATWTMWLESYFCRLVCESFSWRIIRLLGQTAKMDIEIFDVSTYLRLTGGEL